MGRKTTDKNFQDVWQDYQKLMAEQDLEMTRRDDQFVKAIHASHSGVFHRMEVCEKQINGLKDTMNQSYERDTKSFRQLKDAIQAEKEKLIRECK